jgi:hypothetical protein
MEKAIVSSFICLINILRKIVPNPWCSHIKLCNILMEQDRKMESRIQLPPSMKIVEGMNRLGDIIPELDKRFRYAVEVRDSSGFQDLAFENAFNKSGRMADMVLSGHVHNYQRFTYEANDHQVPYIVAGAGGYPNLTCMQRTSGLSNLQCTQQEPDDRLEVPTNLPSYNLILENYCDNRHGFLRIEITSSLIKGGYYTVPRPQESWSAQSQRIDYFELDIKTHKLIKSTFSR